MDYFGAANIINAALVLCPDKNRWYQRTNCFTHCLGNNNFNTKCDNASFDSVIIEQNTT
jgi:hypothetical protein